LIGKKPTRVASAFYDSNTLLYMISSDATKAGRIEALLVGGGVVSVQVLNEFTAVARRKFSLPWPEIEVALDPIKEAFEVEPVTLETYDLAVTVAQRFGYTIYDSLIIAAALIAGCDTLYSEDMQHGQVVADRLTILNPFL
jgi:predicted nucleic acid-binding protein